MESESSHKIISAQSKIPGIEMCLFSLGTFGELGVYFNKRNVLLFLNISTFLSEQ